MSFWIDTTSIMILDHCGDTTLNPIPATLPVLIQKDNKLATALNETTIWAHDMNHTHTLTLDLGKPHYITSIKGVLNATTNIQHVAFYVSEDTVNYGNPVLEINDWQSIIESESWAYLMNTPKVGRYVLIQVLSTIDPNNYLRWG